MQVISRWEEYMSKVRPKQGKGVEVKDVAAYFPFHKYFSNAPQPVFKGRSYEEDMDISEGCYRHIKKIFTQLEVRSLWHRRVFLDSQGHELVVAQHPCHMHITLCRINVHVLYMSIKGNVHRFSFLQQHLGDETVILWWLEVQVIFIEHMATEWKLKYTATNDSCWKVCFAFQNHLKMYFMLDLFLSVSDFENGIY